MEPTLIWILVSVLGGFVLALLLGRGLVPALRALKAGQSEARSAGTGCLPVPCRHAFYECPDV